MRPARSSRELSCLLDAPPGELAGPAQEQQWFEALLVWALEPDRLLRPGGARRTTRVELLGRVLDEHPRRDALTARMSAVWNRASAVRLLAEMGLPDRTTFFAEALQRLTDRFVPSLDGTDDLYALVERLGLGEDDALWLEQLFLLPPPAAC